MKALARWLLAAWGLIGQEAMKMRFETAFVDGAMRSKAVMENAQKFMEQMGTDTGGLSAADLAAIPAEATSANMTMITTKPLIKLIGAVRDHVPQADEALNQFRDMTGVDLELDLLSSVGGVFATYTSESTGGGGPGSMVALMSFADRAKFLQSHDRLAKFAKEFMQNGPQELSMASKYIRLRSWKSGSHDVLSLNQAKDVVRFFLRRPERQLPWNPTCQTKTCATTSPPCWTGIPRPFQNVNCG